MTSNSSADEIANVNFVYDDIANAEYSTRRRQRVSVDHIIKFSGVDLLQRHIRAEPSYCTTTAYK